MSSKGKHLFTTIFVFLFNFYANNAVSEEQYAEQTDKKIGKGVFYNEKQDCEDGFCRQEKNYAKIGTEEYSQINPWRKFYVGVDINWFVERFGGGDKQTIHSHNFWRRFQNLDVYGGMRIFRFLGAEVGYSHFGDVRAKDGYKHDLDGVFVSAIGYTPHLNIFNYTTLEGYASIGGAMFFSGMNDSKPIMGGKVGVGIIAKLYGALAFNAGVDYYYPVKEFSNGGFLTFKTGFTIYLSI